MINIVTAIGNPILNNELKKYNEFNVVGSDISYFEGILELLELNNEINYIIIGEFFEIKNIDTLFNEILKNNKKIKIIAIINKKNKNIESLLLKKGITDIFYDDSDLYEIINLLKTKNIEYLNIELREEINNLKKLFEEKNNKKILRKNKKIINKNQIIGITGSRGIGKTSFCMYLANSIKKENKILLIDFDLINGQISDLYEKKVEYSKIDIGNLNNFIFKINDNLDIMIGLNILYFYNKINYEKIINNIKIFKEKYDYIIVDTYSEITFEGNKNIFNIFDKIIMITDQNNLEIIKTKKLLNVIVKKWKIDNGKIKYIFYNNNLLKNIFINKDTIYNFFSEIKFIRKNKYR